MLNLSDLDVCHKNFEVAPDAARCPRCGTWSPRNETRSRFFWEANLRRSTVTELQCGCYICPRCEKGQQWFMLIPADFQTRRQYAVPAQRILVDLVRKHKMSVEGAASVGREMLHLQKLDATTVLDWLRGEGEAVDLLAYTQAAVEAFSGQMALDEVYDDEWYMLKATDPLNGIELASHLEKGSPSEDDIRQFLMKLKEAGFEPKLVSTDGSKLYPEVIPKVWPKAKHQRCVFHFIKQINDDLRSAFWDAYETMPKAPKRKRGRPKKRGRPRKDAQKRENRRKVRAARFVLMKREGQDGEKDRFSAEERATLDEAIALCSALGVLRRFVVAVHVLFGPTTNSHELAEQRRQEILSDAEFNATPGLAKSMERLRDDDLFERLTRYLDYENADKTSNHVERENREFRKRQKGHYRMRSQRSLCALLNLLTVRRPVPGQPVRLIPKVCSTPCEEEVCEAA